MGYLSCEGFSQDLFCIAEIELRGSRQEKLPNNSCKKGSRYTSKAEESPVSLESLPILSMLCSALDRKLLKNQPHIRVGFLKAPRAGFEPATNRLTVDRSTAELPRIATGRT